MSKQSARESAEHRKAVVAAQKKAERRRVLGTRIAVIVGVLVVVGAIVAVVLVVTRPAASTKAGAVGNSKQIIPAGGSTPTVTQQATVKRVANTTGITGVLAWDTTGWPGDGT